MRRFIHVALSSIASTVLAVGLLAAPALATEQSDDHSEEAGDHAEEAGEHADEEDGEHADDPDGFGTGEWDGLMIAAAAAAVMGGLAFASSGPGQIGKHDDEH